MGLFPQAFIEDLRIQANIVQVIQEHVSLKRVGRTYKGLCPFHSEKTPSFHVDGEKGFFHCFGCSVGGDVFKFIELHEKVGFADAVRMLAQKVGMPLPDPVDGDISQDTAVREALLKIHELAAAFFREQLASPPGGRARQQLRERGILPQTIDQLGLGYAPPSRDQLKTRLSSQGFSQGLLVQSGLIVEREDRSVVDRFRNRLMVPVCREAGSVIAFGGRAMDPDQAPKYLNSPETPIYSKGRTLYGLNLSKSAIRQLGYAVIVEGYFDFAQVFQSQAAPAVASCGTALTPAQAQLLRRFSNRVVLSFDPDAAGQGAAIRSCELLVAEGFEVNVLVLDRGEDPDTFVRRHGAERYRERLRSSRPYLEYLLDRAASGVDFANDERRLQFLHQMLAVAARIPDAAGRDQFADRIAHKARVTEEVVRAEIRKAAVNRRTEVTSRQLPASGELKQAEKGLIWALVHNSRQGLDALTGLESDDLTHLAGREIFDMARSLHGSTPPDGLPTALLQRLSTQNAQLVTAVAAADSPPVLSPVECARALRRLRWLRERADVQREIDRLQGEGARAPSAEIDLLLRKKHDLGLRIEELN
jgi:DNA primase